MAFILCMYLFFTWDRPNNIDSNHCWTAVQKPSRSYLLKCTFLGIGRYTKSSYWNRCLEGNSGIGIDTFLGTDESPGPQHRGATSQSEQRRLGLWMTSTAQCGNACIRGILAFFLYCGRKWRHVVHLYVQSLDITHKHLICAALGLIMLSQTWNYYSGYYYFCSMHRLLHDCVCIVTGFSTQLIDSAKKRYEQRSATSCSGQSPLHWKDADRHGTAESIHELQVGWDCQ